MEKRMPRKRDEIQTSRKIKGDLEQNANRRRWNCKEKIRRNKAGL